VDKFPGFDGQIDRKIWTETVQIPEQVYSVDGKRFIHVNLDRMTVPSDERGECTFYLNEKMASFSAMTRASANFIVLQALDGKRKTSTVARWANELSLFSRTVSEALNGQLISVITLNMYLWYCSKKNASQEKLLRSTLLWWIEEGAPGIHQELVAHLGITPPPKPRGMIEVQNAVPSERPLSMQQTHGLLEDVAQLYLSGRFNPQENLLWRLMLSEAMRPSQMRLMRFEDIDVIRDEDGRLIGVRLHVALVKQSGLSARDYMRWYEASASVSQAIVDHLKFVEQLLGHKPPGAWEVFCVRKSTDRRMLKVERDSLDIQYLIAKTREHIASINVDFEDIDLFNRRFKHTKLTHLAASGAPLEVLAYAAYQTSTISLQRYVNLTEEAYLGFERQLDQSNELIENAFRGKVIQRSEATHADPEHRVTDPTMEDDVGSCSVEPCDVLACFGCYGCHRFEAFVDGPHERVEAILVAEQTRAMLAGMPQETIHLRDRMLAQVRHVIRLIKG
jgi:hypothetical protein